MRKFEKISFEQFSKDIKEDRDLYESYHLPIRKTKSSAGYDFEAIEDYTLKPNEILKIPTGIRAKMNEDEVLFLFVRSSMGFKYNVRMTNQVGVIDSDYYGADNEGHIFISLQNEGKKDFIIHKGDGIAQGIFTKYLITSDDKVENKRTGGIGSTNQGGKQ